MPICDNAWITSSWASLKTLQRVGFPFLANEPVLSAPVKASKEGSAAFFKGPRARTIGWKDRVLTKIWIVPQCTDEHIGVGRVDPCLCCSISCCVKCMQDGLRVCFLVTLNLRYISLGPLGFAAIGHYSSGSIFFCILDGLFCEVLCQLILCASMEKVLFYSDFSDECIVCFF